MPAPLRSGMNCIEYVSDSKLTLEAVDLKPASVPGGIKAYYQAKIEAAELTINQKTQNLRRLEAQRNALNARGALCAYH